MVENAEVKKISDTFTTLFKGVDGLIDTKKVIGSPYTIGDTTIIPFIETNMGMAVGAFSKNSEAGGMGCKVRPIACLVIQNGFTKLINISNQDAVTKALDLIPDLVDKILKKPAVSDEVDGKVQEIRDGYDRK